MPFSVDENGVARRVDGCLEPEMGWSPRWEQPTVSQPAPKPSVNTEVALELDQGVLGLILLVIGAIGAFLWASWPVCGWGLVAVVTAWACSQAAAKCGTKMPLIATILGATKDLGWATALGIFFVAIAQVALQLSSVHASKETIYNVEVFLSHTSMVFAFAKGSVVLVFILFVALVVLVKSNSAADPRPVTSFLKARKSTARVAAVLTVMSSFTFFSARAVENAEPAWIASLKPRASDALAALRADQDEAAAAFVLQQNLPTVLSLASEEFQDALQQSPASIESVADTTAAHLMKTIYHQSQGRVFHARQQSPYGWRKSNDTRFREPKVDRWARQSGRGEAPPRFATIADEIDRVHDESSRFREARDASVEIASSAIKDLLGLDVDLDNKIITQFVKEVLSKLRKEFIGRLLPGRPEDVVALEFYIRLVWGGLQFDDSLQERMRRDFARTKKAPATTRSTSEASEASEASETSEASEASTPIRSDQQLRTHGLIILSKDPPSEEEVHRFFNGGDQPQPGSEQVRRTNPLDPWPQAPKPREPTLRRSRLRPRGIR